MRGHDFRGSIFGAGGVGPRPAQALGVDRLAALVGRDQAIGFGDLVGDRANGGWRRRRGRRCGGTGLCLRAGQFADRPDGVRRTILEPGRQGDQLARHFRVAAQEVVARILDPVVAHLLVGVLDRVGELASDATVSFGEGQSLRPDAALKKLLEGATPLISLGEAAKPDRAPGIGTASFAAPAGYDVDPGQAQLFADAKRIQTATPGRAWMDCVREAQAAA